MRVNWWGSTDVAEIERWLSEFNPNVLYEPILHGPVEAQKRSLSRPKALFSAPK